MEQIVQGISGTDGVGAALIVLAVAGLVGLFNVLGSALKAARDQIGGVIELYFKLWKLRIKLRIFKLRRTDEGYLKYLNDQSKKDPAPSSSGLPESEGS